MQKSSTSSVAAKKTIYRMLACQQHHKCPESPYFPAPIGHTTAFTQGCQCTELSFPVHAAIETKGQNELHLNPICLFALASLQPTQRSLVKAFKNGKKRSCLPSGCNGSLHVLSPRYAYFKSLAGRGLQTTQLNRFHAEHSLFTPTTARDPFPALQLCQERALRSR